MWSHPGDRYDQLPTSLIAMATVGAYEAKTHLPELLQRVERGEVITITRHGQEVARLVPARRAALRPEEAVALLREARRGVRRGRDSVRRMIEEGRR